MTLFLHLPVLAAAFVLALSGPLGAETDAPSGELENLFIEAGVEGTFVLFDPQNDETVAVNPARAGRRFVPASTFKITNSLIALETGAVSNVDEVVATIRSSADAGDAREKLMTRRWPAEQILQYIALIDDPTHTANDDGTYRVFELVAR